MKASNHFQRSLLTACLLLALPALLVVGLASCSSKDAAVETEHELISGWYFARH